MIQSHLTTSVLMLLLAIQHVKGGCPFGFAGTPPEGHALVPEMHSYQEALDHLDLGAVIHDIEHLFTDSHSCWPADYGHYGPFFVRLAWHCSGTFRDTDGRGGCAGGRMRFEPESHWDDNGNLEFARALLAPIKFKYGDALSWGDLFVTAGTAAIKNMGGPVSQLCVGRIDDPDGTSSLDLGPSTFQERTAPCPVNGKCKAPLGGTTVGLIYVNPEGPVVQGVDGTWAPHPDPAASALEIRDAFSRMGMDDTETVALIGGGHAFGKTHGACPKGKGLCGTGKGNDTYTSGFEGPWTTTPTKWGNEFFRVLRDCEWEKHVGPGGHWQWRATICDSKYAGLMRLTSDIALMQDDRFRRIVLEFATNQTALDDAFAAAWLKLTNAGGRWAPNKRCVHAEAAAYSKVIEKSSSPRFQANLKHVSSKPHAFLATALIQKRIFVKQALGLADRDEL